MIPERYAPMAYALFRIVFGLIFFMFGMQKLAGWFGGQAAPITSMFGAAGVIETVCGLLIMTGFFVRPAAFLASGEMAWAYFQQHAPRGFWPIQNGGELAVLYCFIFLYFAAVGSGKLSIDSIRK